MVKRKKKINEKTEEKKEIKESQIVREFIDTKFKEIKSEKPVESELEEDVDTFDTSSFTAESQRTAPVLKASDIEGVERTVRDAPPVQKPTQNQEVKYETNYEQISYESKEDRPRMDMQMNITSRPLRHDQQDNFKRVNVNNWNQEMQHPEMRRARDDYSVRMKKSKKDDRLPFEG